MLIILAYPILFFSKGDVVILINAHHQPMLDIFFKYITYLGDGVLIAIVLIFVLFVSYKWSILTALSIVFQSILVSIFKRWLYEGLERPTALLKNVEWHYVEGVDIHGSNTFPSGHTTTAFALFAIMVVVFHHRHYLFSLMFFLLPLLAGLSRIYLLQHFLVDVYFGAIFGIFSVILSLFIIDKIFSSSKLEKLHQQSLRTLFIDR
jgi:membrane-associated phospholipid phosphatase